MIFIGLGSNLVSETYGPPKNILNSVLREISSADCKIIRKSSWYQSAPIPASPQPWFINGVAEVATQLSPKNLLNWMHQLEEKFGRLRSVRNASRTIDLDLLDYNGQLSSGASGPILPHPRLHQRAFVLLPLKEIAPGWIDPRSGHPIQALIDNLAGEQECHRINNLD